MVKALVLSNFGSIDSLEYRDITLPDLQEGEVLIKHSTIGINHMDYEYVMGKYKVELPFIPGVEAVGCIEKTNGNVGDFKVGDRVAYALAGNGAYCEVRNINHKYLIPLPDYISDKKAAAVLFKGMTAHYLTHRTYNIRPNIFVLINGATGGVAMLLTKYVKKYGGIIIGTVGSDEKISIARNNGCDYVLNYTKCDLFEEVRNITKNVGVDVVYDNLGQILFNQSIRCINPFGIMVNYGTTSGVVDNLALEILRQNSIFLTAPSIYKYRKHRVEMLLCATDIFYAMKDGIISENITKEYDFANIRDAHREIGSRRNFGASIINL